MIVVSLWSMHVAVFEVVWVLPPDPNGGAADSVPVGYIHTYIHTLSLIHI